MMNNNLEWPADPLRIDPPEVVDEITAFIRHHFESLNRRFAFVGLSGGLDSSITSALAVQALGKEKVRLFYLPERDSKSIHRQHAKIMANHLNTSLNTINLGPALFVIGVYRLLPLYWIPGRFLKTRAVNYGKRELIPDSNGEFLSTRLASSGGPWVARANAYVSSKHRLRSVILYKEANRTNGLVIGAANRTEWMTGTFTQWGCDHCADLMPLLHLYRSQLKPLAEFLKLPEVIISKKADPDVLPGLDDKGILLGSFEVADQILWGIENCVPAADLTAQFGLEITSYLMDLVQTSAHFRETPYSII